MDLVGIRRPDAKREKEGEMSQDEHVKKIALRKGNGVVELCIKKPKKVAPYIIGRLYTVDQQDHTPLMEGFRSLRQAETAFNKEVKALVAAGYTVLSAWTLNFCPCFGVDNTGRLPMVSAKAQPEVAR